MSAKSKRRPAPAVLSMSASMWDIRYSKNMPAHPTQAGDDWFFDWKQDISEIDYLTHAHTKAVTASHIVMGGAISAPANIFFDHFTEANNTPGGMPASVRFIIQKDLSSEFGRWFSNPHTVVLTPGNFALTVPLTPENWSSVYGKFGHQDSSTRTGFARALAAPQCIGVVFGGGWFFSHGVRVRNGAARFTMENFALE